MSLTYTQLSEAIQSYTQVNESSFVDNIPLFIQNTEIKVNNSVQLPAFRKNVTGTATTGFQYIDLPTDFLSDFSVAVIDPVEGYRYLLQKDVSYIREGFPYPAVTGVPQYYSLFDNTAFLLGPTPDDDYTIEMHYFAYPQSITETVSGTSWLGDNFPNVLLWGSLVDAYIFLKGEADLIQAYQQQFDQAMQILKQLGDGKDRQDTYRVTQVRDKVQ